MGDIGGYQGILGKKGESGREWGILEQTHTTPDLTMVLGHWLALSSSLHLSSHSHCHQSLESHHCHSQSEHDGRFPTPVCVCVCEVWCGRPIRSPTEFISKRLVFGCGLYGFIGTAVAELGSTLVGDDVMNNGLLTVWMTGGSPIASGATTGSDWDMTVCVCVYVYVCGMGLIFVYIDTTTYTNYHLPDYVEVLYFQKIQQ